MREYKLLDLYCGAGGAGEGYRRSGFAIVGVDKKKQPNYPFEFTHADVLDLTADFLAQFDAIHASPPCQFFSTSTPTHTRSKHPNLIPATRAMLIATGKPYIIENVGGARSHLINPLMLCGTMFNLRVLRHRYFENNFGLGFAPALCNHYLPVEKQGRPVNPVTHFHCVTGNFTNHDYARQAMGISWTKVRPELAQAIPPAYTEYVGKNLMEYLTNEQHQH
jgi:DNA (cytosine-5)-methyltransferase 1